MEFIPQGMRKSLRGTFIWTAYWNFPYYKAYAVWNLSGRPIPPPSLVKQYIVKSFGKKYHKKILDETGTFKGQMISAVANDFEQIYSIELSVELFENCRRKFSKEPHIRLFQGDSGKVLNTVLMGIDKPCLFWLDGHYSQFDTAKGELETPILSELSIIFAHPLASKHVILIDDARCFIGENDYPTIPKIREIAQDAGFKKIYVSGDIIRIHN
jgi:hypothetical protein